MFVCLVKLQWKQLLWKHSGKPESWSPKELEKTSRESWPRHVSFQTACYRPNLNSEIMVIVFKSYALDSWECVRLRSYISWNSTSSSLSLVVGIHPVLLESLTLHQAASYSDTALKLLTTKAATGLSENSARRRWEKQYHRTSENLYAGGKKKA